MKNLLNLKYSIIGLSLFFIPLWSLAQVKRVETVDLTVKNLKASIRFFNQVLGFEKVDTAMVQTRNLEKVRMKLGDEYIELIQYKKVKGRPIPANMKSNDLYFQHIAIVVRDIDSAYAILRKYMASPISPMPQTLPKSNKVAAGIRAYYFHDIDHHDLELIYFPEGKGQEKWHVQTSKLFLGIDHTAIGISHTDKSLHFYEDLLGIPKKGESLNEGIEQMNLSNVKGAKVHITGIRADNGPGIEFLQYLKPGPGKPYPKDTKKYDLWYWQIVLVADHLDSLYQSLKEKKYHFFTPLTHSGNSGSYFVVQDPDGHALLIRN